MLVLLALLACNKDASEESAAPTQETQHDTEAPDPDSSPPTHDSDDSGEPEPHGLSDWVPNTLCAAPDRPSSEASISLTRFYDDLEFRSPVQFTQAPGDSAYWFLAEQGGRLHRVANDPSATDTEILLDLSSGLQTTSEAGLLGIAFLTGLLLILLIGLIVWLILVAGRGLAVFRVLLLITP